jgi:hypothetical protein
MMEGAAGAGDEVGYLDGVLDSGDGGTGLVVHREAAAG